jgi:transcriptional regulator with XRE-family HTH domain
MMPRRAAAAMDLGRALRRLRGGLSQAEAARRSAIDASAWSRYERGRQQPQASQVQRIAAGLGVSVEELESAIEWERQNRLQQQLAHLRAESAVDGVREGPPEENPAERTQRAAAALVLAVENFFRCLLAEGKG